MIEQVRSRRWVEVLVAVAAVAVMSSVFVLLPRALRMLGYFAVEHVEVVGTRFTEPYAVVEAAGVLEGSNVFEDLDHWRQGVLSLPLVEDATVRRRLPSTLMIQIREAEPVALVATDRLVPVDAAGRTVALDPAGVALDLPVLTGVDLEEEQLSHSGLAALQLLHLMRGQAPGLADRVSQLHVAAGTLRVVFTHGPEALLPADAGPLHLTQLWLTYADLSSRGELGLAGRIDIRFRDQVVVSFNRTSVS